MTANKILVMLGFIVACILITVALSGCASTKSYSDLHRECMAAGHTFEECIAAVDNYTLNTPTKWGGR